MSRLHISDKLNLPIDAVTQTIGVLAKRRAGKSYTARRFAEQLLKAGQQVAIVDPKGDWWGIRSSADGKSPGLPVIILGGERGDVPLEVTGGEVVAKLIAEERVSVLLDLSLFRKHEVATFMGQFLENLYRLKAREQFRTPMMLIIDEADAIAPQKPYKGEERMLGAAEDIVRRGGQRGIGCMMITQRSAVLNKNVLTQVQMLVALRTIAPQDLAALNAWIDVHGTEKERAKLMESLPALATGKAWFWSPGWPTTQGIFELVSVLPIETFDSGATPKPGEKRVEPKHSADVDLDALRRQMSATIERAKADDPKELRKKIAALERELQKKPVERSNTQIKTVEKPVLKDSQITRLEKLVDRWERGFEHHRRSFEPVVASFESMRSIFVRLVDNAGGGTPRPVLIDRKPVTMQPEKFVPAQRPEPARQRHALPRNDGFAPSGGLRRIMVALAQRPNGLTARQIGVFAGLSSKGGTFTTYLSRARSNGWIEGDRNLIRITQPGIEALCDFEMLPTGELLYQYWLAKLGNSGASRILTALHDVYPSTLAKEEVAERAGISSAGGTFTTYLSRLRSLELIEGTRELKASDELFES